MNLLKGLVALLAFIVISALFIILIVLKYLFGILLIPILISIVIYFMLTQKDSDRPMFGERKLPLSAMDKEAFEVFYRNRDKH